MAENSVVRARIKEEIKQEASVVLETIGLTVSDAFRLLLTRIAREKAMPFEPLVPDNKALQSTRKAAKR